ncbi:electron transport protein SCO1/SenC [Marinobacter santoriniensis NKSG1]|uniref:Electron transport protein SCO1/SenC n=1 Tax=Marinobacter santoriniensis NKSG1 TaxID=1288826 RepID=M7CS28_9GAMM|nr:SCO family protein [Marinobacter santoriniensis]EMP56411.1 electron transport protein SCO1/SenC [Marinobacter santoriniensis NKSG1]
MTHHRALLLLVVVLAGCSDPGPDWHGKDIQNLMPDLAFTLTDTRGQSVTADQTAGKIRLLYFGYTSCPDVCPTTLADLRQAVRALPETTRDDIVTLFVSVDPERDTPERLASYVRFFGDRVIGMTGSVAELRDLTRRYRTTFGYDEPDDHGNYEVSHSSAVYVFDRSGEARLLLRPDSMPPGQIRDDLEQLAREQPPS